MSNLKVIGAGLGRTSTKSLQKALIILGFNPCHHMSEILTEKNEDVLKKWGTIFSDHDMDLLKLQMASYRACVDYPCCLFYKELLDMSPGAKVILSVRDSPEQWAASARATIMQTTAVKPDIPGPLSVAFEGFSKAMARVHGVNMYSEETDIKEKYKEWNDGVIAHVPSGQLLVFNAKEGWEPLCKFLGVDVPDVPYPMSNSTADFKKMIPIAMAGKLGVGEF